MNNRRLLFISVFLLTVLALFSATSQVRKNTEIPTVVQKSTPIDKIAIRKAAKKQYELENAKMKNAVQVSKVSLDTPISLPSDI